MSRVIIVDDEGESRQSLQTLLSSVGWQTEVHPSAHSLLSQSDLEPPGCLVLDDCLGDMHGPELQQALNEKGCELPVIVMTGHGDINTAVTMMRQGAAEVMEKPLDYDYLKTRVEEVIRFSVQHQITSQKTCDHRQRLERLTSREREITDMLTEGLTTKQVAAELNISAKTVDVHRARILRKLEARSIADVVRIALSSEPAIRNAKGLLPCHPDFYGLLYGYGATYADT